VRRRLLLGCAVAALPLLVSYRAGACLVATQDVRVLLGEADEGLVWAVLDLSRREDAKDESTFWWRLNGHVELAPYDGSGRKVLRGLNALSASFKSGRGRAAHYDPPIKKFVDSLAGRIKVAGFRRPKRLRQYTCDYVRACGPWRLQVEGESLVVAGDRGSHTVVGIPQELVKQADLDGDADSKAMAWLRDALRLLEVTEYELAGARVFVLNLAVGDYHSTYGEDEPPATAQPAPMRLIRECEGVACYEPAGTMHHGNHFEMSVVSRVAAP
jgi:hypothetical protein